MHEPNRYPSDNVSNDKDKNYEMPHRLRIELRHISTIQPLSLSLNPPKKLKDSLQTQYRSRFAQSKRPFGTVPLPDISQLRGTLIKAH